MLSEIKNCMTTVCHSIHSCVRLNYHNYCEACGFVVISARQKRCVLKKSGVGADVMRTVYKEYFNTVFDYYFLRIITTLGSNVIIRRIINTNCSTQNYLFFIILIMIKGHSLQQSLQFAPLKFPQYSVPPVDYFKLRVNFMMRFLRNEV